MGHPVRFAILTALSEGVSSPVQLARKMGEPVGNVAYHTRILADLGAIELVDTAQRRGATEHFYRATIRPFFSDEDYALLPPAVRGQIVRPALKAIVDDVAAASSAGGFDGLQVHVSRLPLDLDEQGVEELTELLSTTLESAIELQAASTNRRAAATDDAADGVHTELAILHFDRAPSSPAADRPKAARKRGRAKQPQA